MKLSDSEDISTIAITIFTYGIVQIPSAIITLKTSC